MKFKHTLRIKFSDSTATTAAALICKRPPLLLLADLGQKGRVEVVVIYLRSNSSLVMQSIIMPCMRDRIAATEPQDTREITRNIIPAVVLPR